MTAGTARPGGAATAAGRSGDGGSEERRRRLGLGVTRVEWGHYVIPPVTQPYLRLSTQPS
ncbi:MAG: hypothetical protein ACYDAQ_15475 [Mycobacteriales bacterium]